MKIVLQPLQLKKNLVNRKIWYKKVVKNSSVVLSIVFNKAEKQCLMAD